MVFKLASSPHIIGESTTPSLMLKVILALLPGIAVQCYIFGFGTIVQLILAISTALTCEAIILSLRKRSLVTLKDNTALVTAVLLAIAIPPLAPWWIVVIGTIFAIAVVKHLYGGFGQNIFNPAMAAYVMLLISFPLQMTSWVPPQSIAAEPISFIDTIGTIFEFSDRLTPSIYQLGVDGVTMATPLDTIKTDLTLGMTTTESFQRLQFTSGFGVGWGWLNLAYLAGGVLLLKLKVIRWQIPVSIIVTLSLCSTVGYLFSPDTHIGPLVHLFSGASMLAIFFIATDPVTAATSIKGRLIFGAIIGICVYVIRSYGGYPDSFAFAVLLANLTAPFIDHFVKPTPYGHRSKWI